MDALVRPLPTGNRSDEGVQATIFTVSKHFCRYSSGLFVAGGISSNAVDQSWLILIALADPRR